MTDQWVTADRCSSSSFVPLFSRPGPGAGSRGGENTASALSQHLQCFISWQQSRAIWNIGAAASNHRICSSGEQIFYSKRKPSTLENKYWAGMVDGSLY